MRSIVPCLTEKDAYIMLSDEAPSVLEETHIDWYCRFDAEHFRIPDLPLRKIWLHIEDDNDVPIVIEFFRKSWDERYCYVSESLFRKKSKFFLEFSTLSVVKNAS